LADEPTGNLDEPPTRGVFQLLKDINASGTAVIMATHNLELVKRNEYRVLEVNRGQLVFDSTEQSRQRTPESQGLQVPGQALWGLASGRGWWGCGARRS